MALYLPFNFTLLYFTFINNPKLLCGSPVSHLCVSGSKQNSRFIGKGRLCGSPVQRASLSAGWDRDELFERCFCWEVLRGDYGLGRAKNRWSVHATDSLALSSEWEQSNRLYLLILIPFFPPIFCVTRRDHGSRSAPAPALLSQLQIKRHFGKAGVAVNKKSHNTMKATK